MGAPVTDLVDRPSAAFRAAGEPTPPSPAAARLTRPRWRDGRLVAGVLLVLLAALLGARGLAAADRTSDVLLAGRPMAAGHILSPADLRVGHIRLSGVSGRYWGQDDLAGLTGHPLVTAVGAGDLLARSAVGASADPRPARVVSIPVDPARLPPLAAGDRVDVFATLKSVGAGMGATSAVLRGVEYLGTGDSGSGTTVSIRLLVPVEQTGILVRASQVASLDVVRQVPAGDRAGDVGAGPVTSPGPAVGTAPTSPGPAVGTAPTSPGPAAGAAPSNPGPHR